MNEIINTEILQRKIQFDYALHFSKISGHLVPALVAILSVQQHVAICWCLEQER